MYTYTYQGPKTETTYGIIQIGDRYYPYTESHLESNDYSADQLIELIDSQNKPIILSRISYSFDAVYYDNEINACKHIQNLWKKFTKVYRGKIEYRPCEEKSDVLFLSRLKEPLAYIIRQDMGSLGDYLSVQYYISDKELDEDQLQINFLNQLEGIGDADYNVHYSELTGYLWTDENLHVGGHNLLEELKSYRGKFLYLKITYYDS